MNTVTDWHNIATFLGLVSTLIVTTFKLGRILERFERLEREFAENVKQVPLISRDVEFLKGVHARNTSDIRELKEDMAGREALKRHSRGDFG